MSPSDEGEGIHVMALTSPDDPVRDGVVEPDCPVWSSSVTVEFLQKNNFDCTIAIFGRITNVVFRDITSDDKPPASSE